MTEYNYLPLDEQQLTFDEVKNYLQFKQFVSITFRAHHKIETCRQYLDKKVAESDTPFYGINKGQNVSAGVQTQTLQVALLASLKSTVDCVTAFSETDFRPDMAKIEVPTLVIHGDADQIVPFETTGKKAAELIRGAELKVYEGAPHGFAVTHAQQLNEDLLAFLGR